MTGKKTKNVSKTNYIGKEPYAARVKKDMRRNWALYLMMIPVLLFYLYFHYKPMYGIIIAFQDFSFRRGILGSDWVGFENFVRFFTDPYFMRNIVNTVTISAASIIFGFPAPIILALLINELNKKWFVKSVQTITYMPHFISLVVICAMVKNFVASDGFISMLIGFVTGNPPEESLLNNASAFVPIYVISDIWQQIGWGSIIYLAALTGVDQELYDAADVDGAGHLRKVWSITIPSIMPTIIIMLILRLGSILSVGYEKIILLTNAYNAEKSEVLSYYIYKKGLMGSEYGLATAAGFFNSVINCIFVVGANKISKLVSDTALW